MFRMIMPLNYRRATLLGVLAACLLTWGGAAPGLCLDTLTKQERDWLRAHPVIRMATESNWPPIDVATEDGTQSGIAGDYLTLIERRLGISIRRSRNLSWQEAYTRLLRREADMTTAMAATPEREKHWVFTRPYMSIPIVIVTKLGVSYIHDMHELKGKQVAVIDGYVIEDWVSKDYPEIKLVPVKNIYEGLKAVRREEAFAYLDNLLVVGYNLSKHSKHDLKISGETPYTNKQCMAVRKDWAALAGILQKALDSVTPAEHDAIYKKWTPIYYERGLSPGLLWKVLGGAAAVFALLLLWNRRVSAEMRARTRAEEELRRNNVLLSSGQELSTDGILVVDETATIVSSNSKFTEMWGIPAALIAARVDEPVLKYVTAQLKDPEAFLKRVRELYDNREEVSREELLLKDGRIFDRYSAPMRGQGGEYYGRVWYFRDITENRRIENALRESESSVRRKLDAILSPEWTPGVLELSDVLDVEKLQQLMTQFNALTRITSAIVDMKGKIVVAAGWQDICTKFHRANPETCRRCRESDTALSAGVAEGSFKLYRCKNNMWDMATPIMFGNVHVGNFFLGQFLIDDEMPDRETFRRQAREYGFDEGEYLAALDRVPHWDRDTLNKAMSFYSTFAQMLGKLSYGNLMLANALEERKRAEESLKGAMAKLNFHMENTPLAAIEFDSEYRITSWSEKAEQIFGWSAAEVTGRRIGEFKWVHEGDAERVAKLSAEMSAANKTSNTHINRNYRKDGSVITCEWYNSVLVGKEPGRFSVFSLVLDITERRLLEDRMRQSQKMESVGRLAGGVAHDFNNLLTAIKAYSEFLVKALPEDDQKREDAKEIVAAADRAASLTQQLLAFSRKQVLKPEVLDVNGAVGSTVKMLKRIIGEDVRLETRLAPVPCPVLIDPGQISQILLNLAVNSRDAMPKGGDLVISTEIAQMPPDFFLNKPELKPGPLVRITVRDSGCGMPPEVKEHIFEPFFTTKGKGLGTGLGLATVYGIVKQSGGEILFDSETGKGTGFTIYLPQHTGPAETASRTQESVPTGKETILFVEDEESLRRLGERILGGSGYSVITAADGATALELLKKRSAGPVDLIITDVVMPGMSGREMAKEAVRRGLAGRVLYVSGYTDDAIITHGVMEPGLAFMYKPYNPDAMLRKVREILDGPAGEAKA